MHQEDKTSQIDIDLLELIRKLYQNKYFILKLVCISTILGIIISFSIPSKYCVKITISPETGQTGDNGNLTGMASVLGLGGFGTFGKDAINSNMFPDIIQTTPFIIDIYNIKVSPQNQEKEIPLHKYLDKQKYHGGIIFLTYPVTSNNFSHLNNSPKHQMSQILTLTN